MLIEAFNVQRVVIFFLSDKMPILLNFLYLCTSLMIKNMEETEEKGRKVSIDLVKANVFGFVIMVVAAVVLLIPFSLIWSDVDYISGFENPWSFGLFVVTMLVGIVVHELIHGATWACYAPHGWKSISFGVIWKMLTPYCHCDEPMTIRAYKVGAIMPCVILGVIPSIVALIIGDILLLFWGIIFISAAAGDIWMYWLLTKEDPNAKVLDHPTEAGFYVFED